MPIQTLVQLGPADMVIRAGSSHAVILFLTQALLSEGRSECRPLEIPEE
jgi:hypothetical protein